MTRQRSLELSVVYARRKTAMLPLYVSNALHATICSDLEVRTNMLSTSHPVPRLILRVLENYEPMGLLPGKSYVVVHRQGGMVEGMVALAT